MQFTIVDRGNDTNDLGIGERIATLLVKVIVVAQI